MVTTGDDMIIKYNLCLCQWLWFVTCSGSDGLADQTDTGVVTGHHCNAVVLPTSQVEEITGSVCGVALSFVAETAVSIDGVRCGAAGDVPRGGGDACLTVD